MFLKTPVQQQSPRSAEFVKVIAILVVERKLCMF
jgi:hypothetical protein